MFAEDVDSVLDIHSQMMWHKERRVRAYGFPLDAFTSHGRPAGESTESDGDGASESEAQSEASAQQELQAVLVERTGESATSGESAVSAAPVAESHSDGHSDSVASGDGTPRATNRPDHACGGDGQTPAEAINELDEIEDLDHLDLGELSPQVRLMVETFAAKLDSQDKIDGGEHRLTNS